MNTHAIVVEMHQNMLRTCEDTGSQSQVVSKSCTLHITEETLTSTQIQNRLVALTTREYNILYLHLAYLGNHHLHHQGFTLDTVN